jgi:hypothetical protein
MEARDGEIRLFVDDAGARYPVTIDPIVNEPPITAGSGGQFGAAVAVDGDTAMVGAPGLNNGDGAVYVYVRVNGAWVEQQKIMPPIAGTGGLFGRAVGVAGNLAIIGAPGENSYAGAAYIYLRAGPWSPQARLTEPAPSAGGEFGHAVAIDGTTVIVGAPRTLGTVGATYVLGLDRTGKWLPQGSITSKYLGIWVSIRGNHAAAAGYNSAFLGMRTGSSWQWWTPSLQPGSMSAVSAGSKFSVILSGTDGKAFLYQQSGAGWKEAGQVDIPKYTGHGIMPRSGLAQIGDLVAVGSGGNQYVFSWNGTATPLIGLKQSPSIYGADSVLAADANHVLVGVPDANANQGFVTSYRLENVTIQSNPPGQPFRLSGPGCGGDAPQILSGDLFFAPFTGYLTDCMVNWAPNLKPAPAGTRFSFQNWADGAAQNPRQIVGSQDTTLPTVTYTGNMFTEYELTTQSIPASGGAVNGAGWYPAGSSAPLVSVANAGFQFAGYTGDLKAAANPFFIKMDAPKAVNGNFTTVPPASLAAMILPASGPPTARNWTISVLNEGPGIAQETYLFLLGMRQTAGVPCVAMPVRLSPVTFPAYVGMIPVRGVANVPVTLDFSGCPQDAQFMVNLGFAANGGSSGGIVRVMNQAR